MSDYHTQAAALEACFEKLFALPESANVSTIIKKNPSSACADALAAALLSSAQSRPLSVDVLVQSLVAELSLTEDLFYTDNDAGYYNFPFNGVFEIELADYLTTDLLDNKPKQTVVSPQNTVLSSALFGGERRAKRGLHLHDALAVERKKKEVVAIRACLVLLAAGSMLADVWTANEDDWLGEVTEALKASRRVVKYPTGLDLLERTIDAAQGGFQAETTAEESWRTLFPGPMLTVQPEEVAWPTLRSPINYIGEYLFRMLLPASTK